MVAGGWLTLVMRQVFSFQSSVEACFGSGGRDVPYGFKQAAVVELADSFEDCMFDGLEVAPRATAVNDFGLEPAVNCRNYR